MTQPFATLAGERCTRVVLHVPPIGPWWADVDLEGAPEPSGRVTLALGALSLSGTIDASHNGTHGLQRRCRVIAGGGGWSRLLLAKAYHNDALVRARTVAEDAAREAGEELVPDDFAPTLDRIGADYVRQSGPASRVLEDIIGGVPWWVGYDGRTHVAQRASSTPAADAYEVLEYVPDEHLVTLAVDDLTAIGIGSVLSERLDEPQTVRELEIEVSPESARVKAWTGGVDGGRGRLPSLLRAVIARATDGRLFGKYRYRVVRMSSDRVELQAVRRAAGLPDVLPVSMWPGLAGAHADLTASAEVLVEFIEGDRTMPIVTHFVGKGGPGHAPTTIVLSVTNPGRIRLGGPSADTPVALATLVQERIDKIQEALDTLVSTAPVANDGGAAIQTAVKAVWGAGPTAASDVGSNTVRALRGALGSIVT